MFTGALILAMFINLMPAIGRDAPITTIGNATPCPGSATTLAVTVTNFSQITAVSLRIDYNPALLTWVSATNLNATLTGMIVNETTVSPTLHKIIFVWSDINPTNLTNGSKLADLNFTFISGSGSVAFNNTSSGGSDCEYGDENGNPMNDMPTASFYFNSTITDAGVGAAGAIAGTNTVCQSTNAVAYSVAAITNATGYAWTVPTGATIASGSNTNAITVNYGATAVSGNVTVHGTNACSTPGTTSTYAVTVNARPTPTIGGLGAVCVGTTGVVYTTEAGMSGYVWSVPTGGTITAGQGTNAATVTWTTSGAQTITVTYTGVNTCAALTPTVKNVTVNPLPVPTITGPAVCGVGTTGNVYTTQAGMTNYIWVVSGGGTVTSGGTLTDNTVTITWTVATPQSVSVTYTNGNGCVPLTPTVYPVSVITLPGPAGPITGTTPVCQNTNGVAYSVAAIVNASGYVWTLPTGATIATGANTNAITVNYSPTAVSGSMSVHGTNVSGSGSESPLYAVTVNPSPTPTITGPATVCAGSAGNVYTTQAAMTNYVWVVSAGGTVTAGGTGTSNTVTVTWTTAGAKTVTVNYTNATGCSASVPTTYPVTVNPSPSPTISGPAQVCSGVAGNVYTSEAGMTNYVWTVSAGGTITAGGTATSNTVTVTWTTAGAKTVSVNYNNASGCAALVPVVYNVTVNPSPTPTITGQNVLCVNSGFFNYSTQTGMTGYVWTITSGGTITAGQGTSAIQVVWNTPGAQTLTVNYSNASSCSGLVPGSLAVTVNPLPGAAGTISGPAEVCAGTTQTYSIPAVANAVTYVWSVPAGATITGGLETNSITVSFSAGAVSGNISVYANNLCGSGTTSTTAVTIRFMPEDAGPITGPALVCQGAMDVPFSVLPIRNATSYTWNLPAGATFASGAGTNSITINLSDAMITGTISVYGTSLCGNGTVSPDYEIVTSPNPAQPAVTLYGTDSLVSSAPDGNQWYEVTLGLIPGATHQYYIVPATGTYYVVATVNGCSSIASWPMYVPIWPVGVGEVTEGGMAIYPNPNNGEFTLALSSKTEQKYDVRVINTLGVEVYRLNNLVVKGQLLKTLDIRPLTNGVYTVILVGKDNKITGRIIVK